MPDPTTPNLGLDLPTDGETPWYTQVTGNWNIIDTFAGTVVLYAPATGHNQTVTQPAATYLRVNALQLFGAPPSLAFGVTAGVFSAGLSMPSPGVISTDANSPGDAAGTSTAAIFDAGTGFQVAGAAASGFALVGNGTDFVPTALSSLNFYQTVQSAAASRTQRPRLNFLSAFTATDNSGNTSTDVALAATGVTAGSYSNPILTVNPAGQITNAVSGGITVTQAIVTGSRAFGVVYQNGTAFPITALVTAKATGSPLQSCLMQAAVGPTNTPPVVGSQSALLGSASDTYGGYASINFTVAASDYYEVTLQGPGTLNEWIEWSWT